jgi:hypothetical protein
MEWGDVGIIRKFVILWDIVSSPKVNTYDFRDLSKKDTK